MSTGHLWERKVTLACHRDNLLRRVLSVLRCRLPTPSGTPSLASVGLASLFGPLTLLVAVLAKSPTWRGFRGVQGGSYLPCPPRVPSVGLSWSRNHTKTWMMRHAWGFCGRAPRFSPFLAGAVSWRSEPPLHLTPLGLLLQVLTLSRRRPGGPGGNGVGTGDRATPSHPGGHQSPVQEPANCKMHQFISKRGCASNINLYPPLSFPS